MFGLLSCAGVPLSTGKVGTTVLFNFLFSKFFINILCIFLSRYLFAIGPPPIFSVSPTMKNCGGDHHFCPSGTVAPIEVYSGFYTADYDYESCPPGKWRNLTYPLDWFLDVNRSYSYIPSIHPIEDCQLCPEGTYKSKVGNDIALCRKCDPYNSISSADRSVCECTKQTYPGLSNHFDIIAGTSIHPYNTSYTPIHTYTHLYTPIYPSRLHPPHTPHHIHSPYTPPTNPYNTSHTPITCPTPL